MKLYSDGMECNEHPDYSVIVIIDNDGQAHIHSHWTPAATARTFAKLTEQMQQSVAREALQHGHLS